MTKIQVLVKRRWMRNFFVRYFPVLGRYKDIYVKLARMSVTRQNIGNNGTETFFVGF